MNNQQNRLYHHRQNPVIPRSTVVGFRVSPDQLEKLNETRRTLQQLGITGTTSDSLRIILTQFDLRSWKTDLERSLTNKVL